MPTQDSEKWPLSASLIFPGRGPILESRGDFPLITRVGQCQLQSFH
jgi:hypothetical protein